MAFGHPRENQGAQKMNYEKMSKNDGLETKPETRAKRVNIKTFIGK